LYERLFKTLAKVHAGQTNKFNYNIAIQGLIRRHCRLYKFTCGHVDKYHTV